MPSEWMNHRVVITGIGPVAPIGVGREAFWQSILSGRSGAKPIERFDTSALPVHFACMVEDFNPDDTIDPKEAQRMDLYSKFAMAASEYAIRDSGIDLSKIVPERFGVILGTGVGGIETFEQQVLVRESKGARRVSPLLIPTMIPNIAAGQVAIRYGMKGPNYAIATACATGAHCIGEAVNYIRRGIVDGMLAGGSEAPVCPMGMNGFASMRQVLSKRNDDPQRASRPFDAERDGFVMGEGAGVVVLESLEHATKRGANILCEITGFGLTCDAHHITAPAPGGEGAARAIKMALAEAQCNPEDVDYINAHGTSTPLNDKEETQAVKTVFGDHARKLAMSSTKSQTGHLLGAAGGVEAIACALALVNQVAPGTINYENPDPECDLDYVPNAPREMKLENVLSNSLGFGGHNATLLFKRWNGKGGA